MENKFLNNNTFYDFKDVLILPKSSQLNSRSEVELETKITFKNGVTWSGIPIIAANMTSVGTFAVYNTLSKYKIITSLHKFYKLEDYLEFNKITKLNSDYFMVSCGISNSDYNNLIRILNNNEFDVKFICIDVANGYIENFKNFCKKIKNLYPSKIIVAGNVTTQEGVKDIISCGVDIIKCGIGGGCFKEDTRILMSNGIYKNIKDICEGDYVINKNGKSVKVLKKINNGLKNFINIKTNNWYNNTYVTPEHNYWINDYEVNDEVNDEVNSETNNSFEKYKWKNIEKYKWENIENCYNKQMLLMPKNISWELPNNFCIDYNIEANKSINSTYDLGYIFATYLNNTNSYINNHNIQSQCISCHWTFNNNTNINVNKLISCIYNTIEYTCSLKKKNNELLISCHDNNFTKILEKFSNKNEKFLPEIYYCKNKDYIQGLYDGLIESNKNIDKNNFTNTNHYILELFYWCCMNLQIPYYSNDYNDYYTTLDNNEDYSYSQILNYDTNILIEIGWDIEVDCETHSFIANNSIVHNSACTTRIQTGIGMPQLSCILECAEAIKNSGCYIISDGGITCPGDLAKAFGSGSNFVMIGGLFAGHDENPGELIVDLNSDEKYKFFYGMSSSYAMKNNYANNNNTHYRSSEGREIKIKYKGKLDNSVESLLGGIRSTCTYTNSSNISQLKDNCKFILVNNQYNNSLVNK